MEIEINKIQPNPDNPRKSFHNIKELADDIKLNGLIQKILVRPVNDYYEIVQGERRFKALQLLQRDKIDCEVKELSKEEAQRIALAENLQREDLSVIELAKEFKKRLQHTTQQKLAKEINKSQPYIVKILKFLELPESVYPEFDCGIINMEQGKELLRFMKYLKMLQYDDEIINLAISSCVDFICKESKDKKLREIIDDNILWRIRFALLEKGEEFILNFNNGKSLKIIKKEEQFKPTNNEEFRNLMIFLFHKTQMRCSHEWIYTEYDVELDKTIDCKPYCSRCSMLKGAKLKNL